MIRGKVSAAQETGPRYLQEDAYVYFPIVSTNSALSGWLLAVMDGHSHTLYGNLVSKMCREYIPRLFSINHVDQAAQTLSVLVQKLDRITYNMYCGSTLSLALVLESHHMATFAILGDSPIFLFDSNNVCALPNHNVRTNCEERRNAELRGGVYQGGYIWIRDSESFDRVPRGLQPTEALVMDVWKI